LEVAFVGETGRDERGVELVIERLSGSAEGFAAGVGEPDQTSARVCGVDGDLYQAVGFK
jgi:hypothetical protein